MTLYIDWHASRWQLWLREQAALPELPPEGVSAWLDTEIGLSWERHAHQQVQFYLITTKDDNENNGPSDEGIWWGRKYRS